MEDTAASVSGLVVFSQGLLSFFSPCVLPLVPLYLGYLSGGTATVDANGAVRYRRGRVMANTLFFTLGIGFAFFLLGLGFSALGRFFSGNQRVFSMVAGVFIILLGVYQVSGLSLKGLERERRLPFKLDRLAMSPLAALVLGFTFSFAWTPCVGPALTSVLLMASGGGGSALTWLLIGMYTLGFILPFLAVGLFTGALLDFFKKHQKALRYTVKIGGVLLILMGIMTLTGWMYSLSGSLARLGGPAGGGAPPTREEAAAAAAVTSTPAQAEADAATGRAAGSDTGAIPAPDFTLTDQNGERHTLSDYQGQVVFLNFWATWCPPCRQEMPDIQQLYEDEGENGGDVAVLGVALPLTEENSFTQDGTVEEITEFLEEGGYTYPTAMDETGEVFSAYGISAYPTTFIIDPEGNVLGYVPGMLSREQMDQIVALGLEE